jgi:hypothetical protein
MFFATSGWMNAHPHKTWTVPRVNVWTKIFSEINFHGSELQQLMLEPQQLMLEPQQLMLEPQQLMLEPQQLMLSKRK